ncbi:cytochrome C oxidase assembly protein [Oceanicola sp. 22II-s10i]|uniref:hypothetical protein n=1 Tax=Oceanicola sp. 22II-s10i TaxID=1317116 RepID=UPI000B6F618F|nr:hypothetical protein [Oceanicola sp. 22II-s10i]OWU86807.1 cytochrome C oxidase assembly protein [Oceanicola sp. 22II-s10i]
MQFREEHELHKRRWSRNLGLGLVLAAFVALVFGMTVVKVSNTDFSNAPGATPQQTGTK